MFAVERILVPVDYSEVSRAALSVALQVAHLHNAKLYILRVHEKLDRELQRRIMTNPNENTITEGIEQDEDELKEAIELEYTRAERAGKPLTRVETEMLVTGGDWLEVATNLIEREQLDLVVSGTHGPKGIKGFFMGSVTEQLVAKATCSVFVVKPTGFPYLRD